MESSSLKILIEISYLSATGPYLISFLVVSISLFVPVSNVLYFFRPVNVIYFFWWRTIHHDTLKPVPCLRRLGTRGLMSHRFPSWKSSSHRPSLNMSWCRRIQCRVLNLSVVDQRQNITMMTITKQFNYFFLSFRLATTNSIRRKPEQSFDRSSVYTPISV